MPRTTTPINELYGLSYDKLIDMKNSSKSKYTRVALTTISMRYKGYSNAEIAEATGLSNVTIVRQVNNWNKYGLKSVEESRGGKRPHVLSPDIVDDLLYVVRNKVPLDFEFIGHTWTLALLSLYIKQYYDIDVSGVTIRKILIDDRLSHKRAQPKPTKADKADQEAFKKNVRASRFFRIFI